MGLFYFGLPSVFEKLPEEKDVLTFEVVPLSAIANIKTENKSTQKEKIAEKSKEIKASKPVPKKQVTPLKKIIEKEIIVNIAFAGFSISQRFHKTFLSLCHVVYNLFEFIGQTGGPLLADLHRFLRNQWIFLAVFFSCRGFVEFDDIL